MGNKRRNNAQKADNNRLSLMYTLHVISRLDKDEFELLKKLRGNKALGISLKEKEMGLIPRLMEDFNVKSIQEVIDIVENFKLFELYDI